MGAVNVPHLAEGTAGQLLGDQNYWFPCLAVESSCTMCA
jgi:hypothetical protein